MAEDQLEILGVSINDGARALGCSTRTIWNMIGRGDLRTFKVGPKLKRIVPEDIRAIAARATRRSK